MNFKVGDIIKVISKDAFYYGALGEVADVNDDEIYVQFKAEDDDTGEVFVYEDCYYYADEIDLIYRENDYE